MSVAVGVAVRGRVTNRVSARHGELSGLTRRLPERLQGTGEISGTVFVSGELMLQRTNRLHGVALSRRPRIGEAQRKREPDNRPDSRHAKKERYGQLERAA